MKLSSLKSIVKALENLGYRPSVPVSPDDFADPAIRQQWIDEKGMRVLNLFSDLHPETQLDLFVNEPFDFDREYENALRVELEPNIILRVVSIPTLIAMKREAGRNLDYDDIQQLEQTLKERKDV